MANTEFTPLLGVVGRKAELAASAEADMKGMSYWARQMGDAGVTLRSRLLDDKFGMSPEDKRALAQQDVLDEASRNMQLLASQGYDSLTAQELALTDAMSAFVEMGDFDTAQSLAPKLAAIQSERLEMRKLRAEGAKEEALTGKALAETERTSGSLTDLDRAKIELERVKQASEGGLLAQRNAQAAAYLARARLLDRTDPNLRKGGDGAGKPKLLASARENIVQMAVGAKDLFSKLGMMRDIYAARAAAASKPGEVQSSVTDWVRGFAEYTKEIGFGTGVSPEGITNDTDRSVWKRNQVQVERAIANAEKSLNVDRGVLRSLVLDTAFAIARANDPGGRLSDNDFKYSLEMLGALQDPVAAVAVFDSIAKRVYDRNMSRYEADPAAREELSDTRDFLMKYYGDYSKQSPLGTPAPAAAGPVSPERAAELLGMFSQEQ